MSGKRAGHEIGSPHPIHRFGKISLSIAVTLLHNWGIHRVDITLFDEYSIVHLLIKFRDRWV